MLNVRPQSLTHDRLVVVVSEAQTLQNVLRHTLEADGWTVLPLEDGSELFDFLELVADATARSPQLVVIDASVPGPSVPELITWAREHELPIPFVVMVRERDSQLDELARTFGGVELAAA